MEIILLLIIAFISAGVSGFSNASLGVLKAYFIEPIMFYIVFVNVFKFKENRQKIFMALGVSALAVSLVAIYQAITGQLLPADWVNSGRVTGVFAYPNALGLYLAPILILLFGFLLSLRAEPAKQGERSNPVDNRSGYFYGIASLSLALLLAMTVIAVFFAHSQGAMIGLAAALLVFGILYNLKTRLAVTLGVFAAVIVLILNPTWLAQLQNKVLLRDLDGQIRRQQWTETWQMLLDGRIIFGAGLANYQKAVAPYHQSGIYVRNGDPEFDKWVRISLEYQQQVWQPLEIYLYPHNIFLNFWSELGLAGMLLFILIIIKYLVFSIQYLVSGGKHKATILGLACAMIVIIIHGLVDVPYFKNDLAVLFWVLIGMLGVYRVGVPPQINKSFYK